MRLSLGNLGRAARALVGRGERRSAMPGTGYVAAAPVLSGAYVTPDTAIGLAACYAAINVISRDIATLPCGVYSRLGNGGLRFEATHPYTELLTVSPDQEIDAFKYHQDSTGHVLARGNGYSEIVRERGGPRDGRPRELAMMSPKETTPKRNDAGRLYYELKKPKGNDERLLPEDVIHFAGLGYNGLVGYSPIAVARQTVGLAMAVEQFGAAFFGNGAVPAGKITVKKKLKEEALNNLRRSFNQVHQGPSSAHQVMVLEEDMDWDATAIPPEDAQFLETRKFQVVEIARLFSLPPHKIGDYTNGQLANVEQANLDYIVTTLAGWVAMREAQLNWKLLTRDERRELVIRHDMGALLRGDSAARVAYYQGLRNLGAINADEIRAKESMNPIGPELGGNLYLVQSQYTRLDLAGVPKEPPQAQRSEG